MASLRRTAPIVLTSRSAALSVLLAISPSLVSSQDVVGASDSTQILLLERVFGSADSIDAIVVSLERRVVYRVELEGPGTLLFRAMRGSRRLAFVVPLDSGSGTTARHFEVYALQTGPHAVVVADLAPGVSATLRLYRDVATTRRLTEKRERGAAAGFLVAAGVHSGYRLDPTGGADPGGGGDIEGCLLLETGGRFATCIGVGRQHFPDAGFSATWLFIEERARLVAANLFGERRTDLGIAVRYSQAQRAGPRHLSPGLLGVGVYVRQYLARPGLRSGLAVFCSWQHARLGDAPETERLDTNRFTAGVIWIPR